MKLNNKRIVITGGTSGIGYKLVSFLQINNEVIIIARDSNKLKKLAQQFNTIITFQADLSNPEEVEIVSTTILNRFQSIDVLINNVAVQCPPTFIDDDFEYKNISYEINLNFTCICSLTYLLLPLLRHKNQTVILNVNSGLALAPKTSSAIYCATKGALKIFSQSLRYQLENTNITVQQAFLELVDTAMTKGRGNNKMSAEKAAKEIIKGVEYNISDHDIGKVKILRLLLCLAPPLARKIMKKY